MPFNLFLPVPGLSKLKMPGFKTTQKAPAEEPGEEQILSLPGYTELPRYQELFRRKTDTFEPAAARGSSDSLPSFNRANTDPLLGRGSKSDTKYGKWLRKEMEQWHKALSKGDTTDDFDTWLHKKTKAKEDAERRQARLEQQYRRETREIQQGTRTNYSEAVRHLVPNPYGYGNGNASAYMYFAS